MKISKSLILVGFVIFCLVQYLVPMQMIWGRETTLKKGKEYRFQTEPVDPNDPFRGKYIVLSFKDNQFESLFQSKWKARQEVYVEFETNEAGFAIIKKIYSSPPKNTEYYLRTKIKYVRGVQHQKVTISYPFDRYYMDENKAATAEQLYREAQRDTAQPAYAVVHIRKGDAVLKDVILDGVSIKDLVKIITD